MRKKMLGFRKLLQALWQYLREMSGENDYARYRARALGQKVEPMSPGEFYLLKLHQKYSRISRCC